MFGQAANTSGTVFGQVNMYVRPFHVSYIHPVLVPACTVVSLCCPPNPRKQPVCFSSPAYLAHLGTQKSQPLIQENHHNFHPSLKAHYLISIRLPPALLGQGLANEGHGLNPLLDFGVFLCVFFKVIDLRTVVTFSNGYLNKKKENMLLLVA